MSKQALKKAIEELDAKQLRALLLELYSARKEAKEFLDFFAEPDIQGLTQKYQEGITKELERRGRRQAKPSITAVRRLIKSYATLQPGPEYVLGLMFYTLEQIKALLTKVWIPDAIEKSLANFMNDVVKYADKNGLWAEFLKRAMPLCEAMKNHAYIDGRRIGTRWQEIITAYTPSL